MITIITTYMYKNEICRRHEITCVTRYIISTKKKFLPSNRVIISFPACASSFCAISPLSPDWLQHQWHCMTQCCR